LALGKFSLCLVGSWGVARLLCFWGSLLGQITSPAAVRAGFSCSPGSWFAVLFRVWFVGRRVGLSPGFARGASVLRVLFGFLRVLCAVSGCRGGACLLRGYTKKKKIPGVLLWCVLLGCLCVVCCCVVCGGCWSVVWRFAGEIKKKSAGYSPGGLKIRLG